MCVASSPSCRLGWRADKLLPWWKSIHLISAFTPKSETFAHLLRTFSSFPAPNSSSWNVNHLEIPTLFVPEIKTTNKADGSCLFKCLASSFKRFKCLFEMLLIIIPVHIMWFICVCMEYFTFVGRSVLMVLNIIEKTVNIPSWPVGHATFISKSSEFMDSKLN